MIKAKSSIQEIVLVTSMLKGNKVNVRDPQSMVQYTYVLNNPLLYVGPLGLMAYATQTEMLEQLRQVERGTWKKVYKNGYDENGNEIWGGNGMRLFEIPNRKV